MTDTDRNDTDTSRNNGSNTSADARAKGHAGEAALPPARIDERLDCRELRCPLPLLRTKQALHRMATGGVLEVMATDAGAQRDIPAFLKLSSHRLLGQCEQGGQFLFWIEKG